MVLAMAIAKQSQNLGVLLTGYQWVPEAIEWFSHLGMFGVSSGLCDVCSRGKNQQIRFYGLQIYRVKGLGNYCSNIVLLSLILVFPFSPRHEFRAVVKVFRSK